jgi:hypothetical protein
MIVTVSLPSRLLPLHPPRRGWIAPRLTRDARARARFPKAGLTP